MSQVLIDELGLHGQLTPQEFLQQREEILDRLFPNSQLMPGAEKLIRHLHAHNIPIAVATSSHKRHFYVKTMQHKRLFQLFDHIITGDQVTKVSSQLQAVAEAGGCQQQQEQEQRVAPALSQCYRFETSRGCYDGHSHNICQPNPNCHTTCNSPLRHQAMPTIKHKPLADFACCAGANCMSTLQGKPDPEIFRTAAAGFAQAPKCPSDCLVFEDAPTGVQAGVAAGMHVIMVPDSNLNKSLVEGLGAAAVLSSLEQFQPEHWGLPPYSSMTDQA